MCRYKIYMLQTKLFNILISKQTIPSKKLSCLVRLDFLGIWEIYEPYILPFASKK